MSSPFAVPVGPESVEVHGSTDGDVAALPPFASDFEPVGSDLFIEDINCKDIDRAVVALVQRSERRRVLPDPVRA